MLLVAMRQAPWTVFVAVVAGRLPGIVCGDVVVGYRRRAMGLQNWHQAAITRRKPPVGSSRKSDRALKAAW